MSDRRADDEDESRPPWEGQSAQRCGVLIDTSGPRKLAVNRQRRRQRRTRIDAGSSSMSIMSAGGRVRITVAVQFDWLQGDPGPQDRGPYGAERSWFSGVREIGQVCRRMLIR